MTIPPVQPNVITKLGEPKPWHLMKTIITEPRFLSAIHAQGVKIYRNTSLECILEFPEGTFIQQQSPTTAHERYLISFPNGFQLWVVWNLDVYLLFDFVEKPPIIVEEETTGK